MFKLKKSHKKNVSPFFLNNFNFKRSISKMDSYDKREFDRKSSDQISEALAFFHSKEHQQHVLSTKKSLPVSCDASSFSDLVKNRSLKDSRATLFRSSKKLQDKDGNTFNLEEVHQNKKIRDDAFLQNRINSLFSYLEDFDMMFFTPTEKGSIHRSFAQSSYSAKMVHISKTKNKFNDFMRTYMKNRLFKRIDTSKRFYVRATEMHKSLMLHEHCSFFVPKQNLMESFSLLYHTYLKKDLGRFEVVLDSKYFSYFSKNKKWKFTTLKNKDGSTTNVFIKRSDFHKKRSGEFFYVRFLDDKNKGSQKLQMLKYVMKYILKNSYNDENYMTEKTELERSIYLKLGIRPVTFSRFQFPKYLYFSLKDINTNKSIFDIYSLTELTDFKNSDQIIIHKNTSITLNNTHYENYRDLYLFDFVEEPYYYEFRSLIADDIRSLNFKYYISLGDGITAYHWLQMTDDDLLSGLYTKTLGYIETLGINLLHYKYFHKNIEYVEILPQTKKGITSTESSIFVIPKTNCIFL